MGSWDGAVRTGGAPESAVQGWSSVLTASVLLRG